MAEKFVCDLLEADLVARELTRIHSDLKLSVPYPADGAPAGAAGSEAIDIALSQFVQAVAATQTSLISAVGSAARLFAALGEGTLDLDKALTDRMAQI